MAMKSRVKTPVQTNPSRGRKSDRRDREAQLAGDEEHGSFSRAMYLQQSYGNQATGRLVNALPADRDSAEIARGLKEPYARLAKWLGVKAKKEQQYELWRQFEALSPGQRKAVLLDVAGSHEQLEWPKDKDTALDWKRLQTSMAAVSEVRLQHDEPEVEGNANEHGAQVLKRDVDVTGLLAPYKEIVLWLNYKANKQGKAELMQRFEALSIPQKKLTLHKMLKGRKLLFGTFTEALTITILLKKWVAWDQLLAAMSQAEKIKLDASDEMAVERYLAKEEAGMSEESESEEDIDFLAFGVGVLGDSETSAEEAVDLKTLLSDPAQLSWLLFGTKDFPGERKQTGAAAIVGTPDVIVDRFLQLEGKHPPKSLEKARLEQLKKHGFHSSQQCYLYLLTMMVSLIFERGVMKKEKTFIRLMEKLGLFAKKPIPTEAMIAQTLRRSP